MSFGGIQKPLCRSGTGKLVGGEGVNEQTEEQGAITVKMATRVSAEMLRNLQHSSHIIPES
jgi:hypothetical protein